MQRGGLADYYAERGEAPGVWVGSGLAGLDMAPGTLVTEEQMTALFARGHHPMTDVPLGAPFPAMPAESPLSRALAAHLRERNIALGLPACAQVSKADRAAARTIVARELFAAEHGRSPADARELSSFIAAQSTASTGHGSGVRPDVLTGEERVRVLGAGAARDRETDRGSAQGCGRRHDGVAGEERCVHPSRAQRHPPGRDPRPDRRGVPAPRLPSRRPRSAHPRRRVEQGADPRRVVAGAGRPRASPSRGRRIRAVQHPTGGAARRSARRAVRRTPGPRPEQASRTRDRRHRPAAARDVVLAPVRDHPAAAATGARVPARARQATDGLGVDRARPAGHPGDEAGQARTSLRGRTTRWLAIGCGRAARRAQTSGRCSTRSLDRRPVPQSLSTTRRS